MTCCDDCAVWGLTNVQSSRHHARLARWWADQSIASAERAVHFGRLATRWSLVSLALVVLAFVSAAF